MGPKRGPKGGPKGDQAGAGIYTYMVQNPTNISMRHGPKTLPGKAILAIGGPGPDPAGAPAGA